MTEIKPTDLVKGVRYWIVHRRGLLESDVGVFDVLLGDPPNVNARFLNVQGRVLHADGSWRRKLAPASAYRVNEWSFHEPGARRELLSLQALGRQKPTLPNYAVTSIGRYLTSDKESADQFKTHDDKNILNGVSQPRGGGRKTRTRKTKRRHRKTRRSRK